MPAASSSPADAPNLAANSFSHASGRMALSSVLDASAFQLAAMASNIDLMKSTEKFLKDGYPVLIGTSRKSYIGKMPGLENSDRLIPTVTAGIVAVLGGASCIRVHDVKEAKESLFYLEALRNDSV